MERSRSPLPRPLVGAIFSIGLLLGCSSESAESLLGSAKDFLAKNDVNAASIQLKNALQKDGALAEARFLLGTINLQQGDVTGAIKELRRAGELGYPATPLSPVLARALLQSAAFDQVLEEFEGRTLDDAAAQASLLTVVGDAHLAKANVVKARASYEAAVELNPSDPSALVGLGRAKLFSGDLDGALDGADKALAIKRDIAEAHALRADVLLARGRVPEAIAALEAALEVRPGAVTYHFLLISLFLRQNDLAGAEQRLAAMKKAAPRHASTRYLEAFTDFRKDRLEGARDAVADVVKLAPDYLPGLLLAGAIHVRLNDHPTAQQHLGAVVAQAPDQPFARRLLALSFYSSGEFARALEVLEPVLERPTVDGPTLMLAGQAHLARGDFERASGYFEKAAAASPEDAQARTHLGVSRLAAGDESRAFADLEAAAALDSSAGQAEVALILAHLRRGEFDEAMAAQSQLENKRPDNPQTYNLKGGILLAKKDPAAARIAFDQALAIQPDFISAAINLARLDLADGQPEEARKRFAAIVESNPRNVEAQLVFADLLARIGAKPAEIQAALERAAAASPASLAPKLALVRHHLNTRDSKRALAAAQELASAHGNDPRVVELLARAQLAAGDHQQAISSFNRLAALQPNVPTPRLELSDAHRAVKDLGAAEQALRSALKLQPDLFPAQQRLISLMLESKRLGEALEVAQTVQKQRPEVPAGFVLEGDILAEAGEWDRAASAFQEAQERARIVETAVKLHAAQARAGKAADAEKTAAEWLKAQPDDLVMLGYLAERALVERRLDEAEKLYRRMVDLGADSALVFNNLAWVAGQRRSPDALGFAERALALAPDSPAILDTLGVLQVEGGEHDKGLANLRRAVTLAPDVGALRLNLAKAYARVELRDDARRELDTLLARVPPESPIYGEATALRQGL